jgi:N-methylhydantoinase B
MKDPITLEVVQESFVSIVREMRANLVRTAYSPVLYEARDFSCVIMDRLGQLVAQAEDNPSHVFPIPWSVRLMFDRFGSDLHPGDIFLHNDPYTGGTHLNDVALIHPVFVEGKLSFFPVIRAHWGDVGGITPGSISGCSTEIFQEGVRIPLIRVFSRGKPDRNVLDLLFLNMRVPYEREGDLEAILGTCAIAETRIRELIVKYGLATVEECVDTALDLAEKRMRRSISSIPVKQASYESYLDSGGDSREPVIVKVRLIVENDNLTVDFTGSSRQTRSPLNAGPAVAPTGAFIILKSFLDPEASINHGSFRPIEFINPEGTIVNATYPAPCGGFSEIRRCVESAVMGALANAIPGCITGDIKGTANHISISGRSPGTGEAFIFYEYPAAGTGAFAEDDGNNAVRSFTEGDFASIQSIEAVENRFPLRVEGCELRKDSGGDGRMRGGCGLRREVLLLARDASLSILSDKNIITPFGVMGGFWGAPNRFTVLSGDTVVTPGAIPGKVTGFLLRKGDKVVMETSGGGGFGDPLERPPERVVADLRAGLVSVEKAKIRYGIVVRNGDVDSDASLALRERYHRERHRLPVVLWEGDEYEGAKRLCILAHSCLEPMGLQEGDFVEIVNPAGAPLRGWVRSLGKSDRKAVHIGKTGMEMLRVSEGEEVEVRKIDSIENKLGESL